MQSWRPSWRRSRRGFASWPSPWRWSAFCWLGSLPLPERSAAAFRAAPRKPERKPGSSPGDDYRRRFPDLPCFLPRVPFFLPFSLPPLSRALPGLRFGGGALAISPFVGNTAAPSGLDCAGDRLRFLPRPRGPDFSRADPDVTSNDTVARVPLDPMPSTG